MELPRGHLLIARQVDPETVDFQPRDRSRATAERRAISLTPDLRAGRTKRPLFRLQPNGRFEIWDGNARVVAHRKLSRPIDALVVGPRGELRHPNAQALPVDRRLWDELVAEARSRADAQEVSFRWPSPEADAWLEREYVAAGGRFGQPRPPRRPARERAQQHSYVALFEAAQKADSLVELATVLELSQQLDSPTLRGAVSRKAVQRGLKMGLRCPPRATEDDCADLLRGYGRQRRLVNRR